MKKKKTAGGHLIEIFLLIVFLAGAGLIIYPTFSDWWNSFHQSRAIISYMDEVAQMPGVITAVFKETVGNVIPASGDVAQRVGEVDLLIEDDKKAIEDKVLLIQSKVKVLDEAGENMLVPLADPRSFR